MNLKTISNGLKKKLTWQSHRELIISFLFHVVSSLINNLSVSNKNGTLSEFTCSSGP
jgi:hypothetical protein